MKKSLLFFALAVSSTGALQAHERINAASETVKESKVQQVIKGVVTNGKDPIAGASVTINGTNQGTSTDANGVFSFSASVTSGTITIKYLGYAPYQVSFSNGKLDLGTIVLTANDSESLDEVVVVGRGIIDIAEDRKTPIAVSTISSLEIQEKSVGNVEFPEIMKNTPSVYIADQAGGFGDSKMYVRGFDQSNTAFLLNGQPINGMEDGNLYWSNWSAMSDVANAVQVQRGLGSSKLAISSVGGTVNIITKATDMKRGGFVRAMMGNDGYVKGTVSLNTGLKGKWGMSLLLDSWGGERKSAVGTGGGGQSYFLSLGFKPNEHHNLNFMIFGAPQWHDQNFSKALDTKYNTNGTINTPGYDITGELGNSNYGYLNGGGLSLRTNYYHKPVSNLNWDWNINDKASLSTVLYASIGRGGGTATYGKGVYSISPNYGGGYTENGFVNWDGISDYNQSIANGVGTRSNGTMIRSSVNNHFWYGGVTNFNYDTKTNWSFNLGADVRFYKGDHFRQLVDMLGLKSLQESNTNRGTYSVTETFSTNPWSSLFNYADKDQRINYDNSEKINYQGGFGQVEYSNDFFSAFVQGSVSNQSYQKFDRWNYEGGEAKSAVENKLGYNVKGGIAFHLNSNNTIFANAGRYSRQPFLDNVFIQNTVDFADPKVDNEEITGFEAGYKFETKNFRANLNAYYTSWKNRFLSYTGVYELNGVNYNDVTYIMTDIAQLHKGIEFDFDASLFTGFKLRGYTSIGDWEYDGTSPYYVRNDENSQTIPGSSSSADFSGVKVGNAAQFTVGAGIRYSFLGGFVVDADYNRYDRLYANVNAADVAKAALAGNVYEGEKLKAYSLIDLGFGYTFDLKNAQKLKLRGNVKNLLNEEFFARKDAYGYFYGLGTTWNAGLTYSF